MAYGVIKKLDNGQVRTPNAGVLMDLQTGLTYTFLRPDPNVAGFGEWNVKLHDVVTFTISGSTAINVTLYKKHIDGIVYSYDG